MTISRIPTWEELKTSVVGTQVNYNGVIITRKHNHILVEYPSKTKKVSVICFSKDHYKTEIRVIEGKKI